MKISKDDYDRWLNDEVTREVHKILRERQNKIAHGLAQGSCMGHQNQATYGQQVGHYAEIDDLLNMTHEDMLPKEV